MENFITPDMFLSLSGCILIVAIATQLLKKYVNYDAKWLALLMSGIVTFLRIIVIGDYSVIGVITGVLNIVPILLGSIGGYETFIKPVKNLISNEDKKGDE